ncbi:putative trehalose-6-phosphate synthase/trehalose phosphatase [Bradyrhizobium oligotrophicum S58]|uniref:Putative trehalose-6-phosphate synthase/trehalose phosphatase n=1 Tax=Bradyrhizobium oligotrophicum S58 TaxID=1245469 RepID=M4Z8J9_9BRAD|nr:putative trehalose-6-phosphate synthase/trehalose phosphatase [Bradyrhizobium oligotrophicum S58]
MARSQAARFRYPDIKVESSLRTPTDADEKARYTGKGAAIVQGRLGAIRLSLRLLAPCRSFRTAAIRCIAGLDHVSDEGSPE